MTNRSPTRMLSEALQDARFGLRMMTRRKTFSAVAIAVLGLGIGASTAIFSLADSVLFRPLPFPSPDRLAAVWITQPTLARDPVPWFLAAATPMGTQEYQAPREHAASLDQRLSHQPRVRMAVPVNDTDDAH